jgi:hypothetical protein
MNKNVVIVYGSGASLGSGYKTQSFHKRKIAISPPTDRGFFSEDNVGSDVLNEKYHALWKFKQEYFPPEYDVGLEELWTAVDLNHKHITLDTYKWNGETRNYIDNAPSEYLQEYGNLDLSDSQITTDGSLTSTPQYNKYKFLGDCGRDFRRLVYDAYANYERPENDDENLLKELHSIAIQNSKLLGYVTFNYDCFLEDSLGPEKFKYIHFSNKTMSLDRLRHGGIPIIKLHGSLNWEQNSNGFVYFSDPPYQPKDQVKPTYISTSVWSQPAIIPPTLFKQEINDDSRAGDFLTQAILQQWRAAITLLQEANTIIFVGYSFPPTDFHAKRIFQLASMTKRKSTDDSIKVLDCIGPGDDPKEEEDKKKFLHGIFGKGDNLIIKRDFKKSIDNRSFLEFLTNTV